MASETVSAAQLLSELRADPGFASEQERCELALRLVEWYTSVEDALREQGEQLACAKPSLRAAATGDR